MADLAAILPIFLIALHYAYVWAKVTSIPQLDRGMNENDVIAKITSQMRWLLKPGTERNENYFFILKHRTEQTKVRNKNNFSY